MSSAIRHQEFDEKKRLEDCSPEETAEYLSHLLDSSQRVAAAKELAMLAHLIGLAKAEAKRAAGL